MAAEFPESDKAQSPSLPSRPCPRLPFPGAAGSRAGSALRRVNHCKNKEMKGSPIGELSAAFSWKGRGPLGLSLPGEPGRRSCPRPGGSHIPPSPGDTAHTIWRLPKGQRGLAKGVRLSPHPQPPPRPAATTPQNRSTKPRAFSQPQRKGLRLEKKY